MSSLEVQPQLERANSIESETSDGASDAYQLPISRYVTNADDDYTNGNMDFHGAMVDRIDHVGRMPGLNHGGSYMSSPSTNSMYATMSSATTTPGMPLSSQTSNSHGARHSSRGSRGGSGDMSSGILFDGPTSAGTPSVNGSRQQRPSIGPRNPSNAYAPPRRPSQFALSMPNRYRSSSNGRHRSNPDADYRAQKKAYVQRLQHDQALEQQHATPSSEGYPPSLDYSSATDSEDGSPSTAEYVDNDPYDQEGLLYYNNEDLLPSMEELKIPANKERLEWHSMLANVLTGDVVRQEKKRLIGVVEKHGDKSLQTEVWMGIRAKVCSRPLNIQKRVIEEQRAKAPTEIESIIAFEIKGETEVGKSAKEQVDEIVKKIDRIENLYPTRGALIDAHPRAGSEMFERSCKSIISWHNTTALINTELGILQSWVGNEELDFTKSRETSAEDGELADESSFIERLLKEDGLKSLQGEDDNEKEDEEGQRQLRGKQKTRRRQGLLEKVGKVIEKAKITLIENNGVYNEKHLPPYIEELLTLINFPSRLVQEIVRVRLSYANKIKDPASQGVMMAEQMMSQFQILLSLAVKVKEAYRVISQPEPGWDLPPCIDENFDSVILDALKYYFKMLNWKLSSNKNTFKEAEVLEQEWSFLNELGRHFEGGDVQVAEHFSSLTSRSLYRLTTHFEKELQRRPNEKAGAEMDRRYKSILDSVRVRQRKLFRFSKLLTQTFENAAEYSFSREHDSIYEIFDCLIASGHILMKNMETDLGDILILASPSLQGRPKEAQSILKTCYRSYEIPEDPSCPYVLVVYPEETMVWTGQTEEMPVSVPKFDIKRGKLRLVAEGAQHMLQNAKFTFMQSINTELDVVVAQRANLVNVDKELQKIKRMAHKLSTTIMDSVEIIRKQVEGLECQELIQTCFAFATEFGQRSVLYLDPNRRALNNSKLTKLALDWISFICDDCIASERKTFRWAVNALEFSMVITRGQNILTISDEEYSRLRAKVSGCMSLLISHFDIMGARSTAAAEAEKQRLLEQLGGKFNLDITKLKDDEECAKNTREKWLDQLQEVEDTRVSKEAERQALGKVMEDSNEAERSLKLLSTSATNVTMRWQQGQYIGGGTFGSVYSALNLDSNYLMAVKEIRLHDPQFVPTVVSQIRDEMGVLQVLDHPNIVSYYGIEVHRDKVYIFMEFCQGGSLAGLLEHGRIEDETVVQVYALQMLEGLAYLHESGIVHRDIKPENILLNHNGLIKYVDFGAAKVIAKQGGRTVAGTDNRGRQRSMTGTPMYMSPEVIRGNSNSTSPNSSGQQGRHGAVDVWSLGCVILEMSTGRRPWSTLDNEWAIMYNIAQGNAPQLPSRDQLSEQGLDFIKRCFERDPARRASAAELLQHEWIMKLRNQLSLDPQTPTSASDSSSLASLGPPSRSNTSGAIATISTTGISPS